MSKITIYSPEEEVSSPFKSAQTISRIINITGVESTVKTFEEDFSNDSEIIIVTGVSLIPKSLKTLDSGLNLTRELGTKALAGELKLLGIGLGSQFIARAFEVDVVNLRESVVGFETNSFRINESKNSFVHLQRSRPDSGMLKLKNFQELSISKNLAMSSFVLENKILGIQFHPEFNERELELILNEKEMNASLYQPTNHNDSSKLDRTDREKLLLFIELYKNFLFQAG